MLVHENDVRLDLALGAFERALDFRELPPTRRLPIGHKINLLPQREPVLERVNGLAQRGKNIRGTIRQRRFAKRFSGEIEIECRLGNHRLHHVAGEQHRRGAPGGHGVQRLLSRPTRLLEPRARAVAHPHAHRVVEDDDARDLRLAEDRRGIRENRRTRERQSEQREEQAAQREQNHVLDPHPALVLFDGVLQEAHRRPRHLAELPTVQQMDDDRHRDGGQPGEHDGVEEAHARRGLNLNPALAPNPNLEISSATTNGVRLRLRVGVRLGTRSRMVIVWLS